MQTRLTRIFTMTINPMDSYPEKGVVRNGRIVRHIIADSFAKAEMVGRDYFDTMDIAYAVVRLNLVEDNAVERKIAS